jgi:G3E family GTPase
MQSGSSSACRDVCGLAPAAAWTTLNRNDDLNARPSHHDAEGEHDHDDFDTFVVRIPAFCDPNTLINRLVAATRAHDILPVRGLVEVAGKPLRTLVQGVGQRYRLRQSIPDRATVLGIVNPESARRRLLLHGVGIPPCAGRPAHTTRTPGQEPSSQLVTLR